MNTYATDIGTILHDVARKYIQHGFKMTRNDKKSVVLELLERGIPDRVIDHIDFDAIFLNLTTFINDAIAYGMSSEVILYYSDNCFGTSDAIVFNERDMSLRIHDLKTGATKAHIEQLMIYAVIFCLEYKVRPEDLKMVELRIYQNDAVLVHNPSSQELGVFMSKIIARDQQLNEIKGKEVLRR